MINDLADSKEIQASFNNSNNSLQIAFGVSVLNPALWPTYKYSDIKIPSEMTRCVELFNEFYSLQLKNRKLTWIYSLGTCDIISRFDTKKIEMTVTTCQAVVLLLFNDSGRLSYQEIISQLNLEDEYATRLLHSLACGKYEILIKDPVNKAISPSDNFEFNPKFTHKLRKIKIPFPQLDENKKVIEVVVEERRHTIQAALVRIMKARKVLPLPQLKIECVEQLQTMFKPEIRAIKKEIDELITKDYFERDRDDSKLLKYIA
jgi:cullin 1